jgi:NAD-reducing hydrogenase large subunit
MTGANGDTGGGRRLTLDVTRIEGHGRVTIHLDEGGRVADAAFHITQFRGFEKIVDGRTYAELPAIMARICGICPVSHLIASAKAGDQILAVTPPPTGVALRKVVNLAQIIQSHALSFFYLSAPDFLLGMDADPAERNVLHLGKVRPEFARDGVRLRQMGQQVIEWLTGRRIHPAWIVAGGVETPLSPENRDRVAALVPEGVAITERMLEWFVGVLPRFEAEIDAFANFPGGYMGLVGPGGELEYYDGTLRLIDADGVTLHDLTDPGRYPDMIGEAVEPTTYLKFPYYKPLGYPAGSYRVGPLARLNIVARCGTPRADAWLPRFRQFAPAPGRPVQASFHYHLARLIDILHAFERLGELMAWSGILDTNVRAEARVNRREGVGISEAPRGTLLHHYRVNAGGQIEWANLVIATGHNNMAMNLGVRQVAERFVRGDRLQEGMLNRVEAVVRTFDPCLSCSTHALGQMPLLIELRGPGGALLDTLRRD